MYRLANHKYAALFVAFSLLLAYCLGMIIAAPPAMGEVTKTTSLLPGQVGAMSATFEENSDDNGLTCPVVWHFVINNGSSTSFSDMTATFQNAGPLSYSSTKTNPGTYHFWVCTSADDTLLSASLTLHYPDGSTEVPQYLKLSHVTHNAPINGSATFTKMGVMQGPPTTVPIPGPLPGVAFTLANPDHTYHATSDAAGVVLFENVAPGTYTLTEDAVPPGYQLMAPIPGIVITAGQRTLINGGTINNIPIQPPGSAGFIKMGLYQIVSPPLPPIPLPLPGASFILSDGVNTYPGTSGPGGIVLFINVIPGTYTLTETIAPPGFIPIPPMPGIVISAGQHTIIGNGIITNIPAPLPGSLSFQKVNKDGTGLANATFQLSDGINPPLTAYSDANGYVYFPTVNAGIYTLTETVPPSGYLTIAPITGIEIAPGQLKILGEQGKIVDDPVPPPGSVSFTKMGLVEDLLTGLAGAEFNLSDGGLISLNATSDADGKVLFENVPAGTYTLTETKAPDGYQPIAPITGIVVVSGENTFLGNDDHIIVNEPSQRHQVIIRKDFQGFSDDPNMVAVFRIIFNWIPPTTDNGYPITGMSAPVYVQLADGEWCDLYSLTLSQPGGIPPFTAEEIGIFARYDNGGDDTMPPPGAALFATSQYSLNFPGVQSVNDGDDITFVNAYTPPGGNPPDEWTPPTNTYSPPTEVAPPPTEVTPAPAEVTPTPAEVVPAPAEVIPAPTEAAPEPGLPKTGAESGTGLLAMAMMLAGSGLVLRKMNR